MPPEGFVVMTVSVSCYRHLNQ